MFAGYAQLINAIIERRRYSRYLEIGVQNGYNLSAIQCPHKDGVDLCCAAPANFHLSSDDFFRKARQEGWMYDMIFVDGDHRFLPALRDIVNALDRLSPDGTVFIDNINPRTFADQSLGNDGTVWRAWATLRVSRRDLTMVAIDAQRGWGIIRKEGGQELYAHEESQAGLPCYFGETWDLTWEYLEKFRVPLMNLVTLEHFEQSIFAAWFPVKEPPVAPPVLSLSDSTTPSQEP